MFLRDLRYRAYNGSQIWRILETYSDIENIQSYRHYKITMSQKITFDESLAYLVSKGKPSLHHIEEKVQCSLSFFWGLPL